jgi:hypothetical protein
MSRIQAHRYGATRPKPGLSPETRDAARSMSVG